MQTTQGQAGIRGHQESGKAAREGDAAPRVIGMATFVTLDKNGQAYAHGFYLPDEYIEQSRRIYEAAIKARKQAQVRP
jgi:hypothetical protein